MFEIGLGHYLTLGAIIFTIGIAGIFLNRKNIIVILMSIELIVVVGGWKYKPELVESFSISGINLNTSNTHSIGKVLYTDYIHLFQLSGMILLVAMIGAIVLTFRKRSGIKRQSYFKQISRERSEGVELTNVESKKGVKIDV